MNQKFSELNINSLIRPPNDSVDALVDYCKKNQYNPPEFKAERLEDGRYRVGCRVKTNKNYGFDYWTREDADTESGAKERVSLSILTGLKQIDKYLSSQIHHGRASGESQEN